MAQKKYDETYKFGNTTVHIVAPKGQTKEDIDKIIKQYHAVGWKIWQEIQNEESEIN